MRSCTSCASGTRGTATTGSGYTSCGGCGTSAAYHRIFQCWSITGSTIASLGFHGDPDLVSATPEAFARQLDYLTARYTPIDERTLIAWLDGTSELPERPLLITFDDGYRDNLLRAAEILNAWGISALLFVCTGFIAGELQFYWDWLADALLATNERSVRLPLLGKVTLGDARSRRDAGLHRASQAAGRV